MLSAVLVLGVIVSSAAFLNDDLVSRKKWDDLKVTWGPDPLSSSAFVQHPRTVAEAGRQGWLKISGCDKSAAWRGERYIRNNDTAVVLLFDVNGYIAGMQTSNKALTGYPPAAQTPPFVPDTDRMTISAYFVDPSIICTTGRSDADFNATGTGSNLYIQTTAVPEDATMIPRRQADIGGTAWSKGKCFPTMGLHYWYNLTLDMNCDDFFPAFLLYNAGELTAFGWGLRAGYTSTTFENPTTDILTHFMEPVPTCTQQYTGKLVTQHIYLTADGGTGMC